MSLQWDFNGESATVKTVGVIPSISSLNGKLKTHFDKLHADVQQLNAQLATASSTTTQASNSTKAELKELLDSIKQNIDVTTQIRLDLEELEKTVVGPSTKPSQKSAELIEKAKESANRASQLLALASETHGKK